MTTKEKRITNLGPLPKGWEVCKISDLFLINSDTLNPQKLKEELYHFSLPAYDENRFPIMETSLEIKSIKTLITKDCILVSKLNPRISRVWLVNAEDYPGLKVSSTEFINFVPCSDNVDLQYYYYLFSSEIFQEELLLKESGSTGSRKRVSPKETLNIPVYKPPLKEQQKIADILSTVVEQIENTDKLIEKTKELKKGLMQQLLTKGIGHIEFKQTELGEIPVEWGLTTLSEISDFITKGATPTTYGHEWVESGIYFFKSDVVKEGKFVYGDYKFISEEAHNQMSRSKILSGDILITITGNIGRVAIVPNEIKEANINQHIARIRIVDKCINPLFIYHWLNQEKIIDYYQLIKTGLAYPQISLKQVRETIIPIPSNGEQQNIAEILSKVDEQIDSYEQEKEKYTELKKGLMQQLLTGKLRVTV